MAKLACAECGAALAEDSRFCPQCGASIEAPSRNEHGGSASRIQCRSCGREVAAGANFCPSCGAPLKGPSGREQQKARAEKKGSGGQRPAQGKQKKRFRLEPWQIVTSAIVLAVAAVFAYMELTRNQPAMPAKEANLPPQPEMMKQIDELQRVVDANPNDDASLLKLANMLHDAGLRSPMLLNRAINTYAKYLARKPGDPNARVDMGICYFELARIDTNNAASLFAQAAREMETALKSNPTHQPAAFNLGIVNLNAGNFEEANKWFEKAKEIDPNSDLGKRAQQIIEQHTFQNQPN